MIAIHDAGHPDRCMRLERETGVCYQSSSFGASDVAW
jgi:hypothetical protein